MVIVPTPSTVASYTIHSNAYTGERMTHRVRSHNVVNFNLFMGCSIYDIKKLIHMIIAQDYFFCKKMGSSQKRLHHFCIFMI